jgi:OmpA-OmpF porin, OOP family
MVKKLVFTSVVLSSLIYSTYGQAAVVDKGIYIDGSLGYGMVNEKAQWAIDNNNTGFGWNANLGYKFTRNWALEVGFYDFPSEDFTYYGYTLAKADSNYAFAIAGKGILPLADRFSLFGKLGLAVANHDFNNGDAYYINAGSHSGAVALLGVGASYALTNNLGLFVQGTATTKSGNTIPAMFLGAVGLSYTFN